MADRPAAGKRLLWTVAALELAGAVALWGASRLAWSRVSFDGGVRGTVEQTVLGAERAPALVPLALLALAGIAGMIATSGWPRRLLCLVLLVAGAAACVVAGMDAAAALGGSDGSGIQPGHGLALLGGLLVAAGGALGARAAERLPKLGERYDNPAAKAETTTTAPAAETGEDLWKALSEGEDPTSRD